MAIQDFLQLTNNAIVSVVQPVNHSACPVCKYNNMTNAVYCQAKKEDGSICGALIPKLV